MYFHVIFSFSRSQKSLFYVIFVFLPLFPVFQYLVFLLVGHIRSFSSYFCHDISIIFHISHYSHIVLDLIMLPKSLVLYPWAHFCHYWSLLPSSVLISKQSYYIYCLFIILSTIQNLNIAPVILCFHCILFYLISYSNRSALMV